MTLIDYYNHGIEELLPVIDSIQKRYLDPYTIRLTRTTENYFFIEKDINKITSTIYGNNVIVKGFEVTNIDYFDDYIEVTVNKGIIIADETIINFIDDFIIRVPKSDLDTTGSEYNIIALDYVHARIFPPRVALPVVFKYSPVVNYNVKVIIAVFKTDGSNTTYLNPDNGTLIEHLTININGEDKEVLPAIGQLFDFINDAKVKADSDDPSPGYLVDKVDDNTIEVDTQNHYLKVKDGVFAAMIHNHNLSDLADVDATDKDDGKVLIWDENLNKHVYRILTFIKLLDTPETYQGQAGKFLKINASEDGIEFSNDGSDSNLNADLLDGYDSTDFVLKTEDNIVYNMWTDYYNTNIFNSYVHIALDRAGSYGPFELPFAGSWIVIVHGATSDAGNGAWYDCQVEDSSGNAYLRLRMSTPNNPDGWAGVTFVFPINVPTTNKSIKVRTGIQNHYFGIYEIICIPIGAV